MTKRGWLLSALWTLLVVGCTLTATQLVPRAPTADQAVSAFNAMYPGFRGSSAEGSGTAWTVSGLWIAVQDTDSNFAVRVPLGVNGSGPASATVGGVSWTGNVDLSALTEARQTSYGPASSIASRLTYFADKPGFIVTDVRRESADSVSVTAETSDLKRPPIVFEWDPGGLWDTHAFDTSVSWLHTVGGVKVDSDRDVTRVLGPGLETPEEGHWSGRYYTNPGHTVTLHIAYGLGGDVEAIELSAGISLPYGLRTSDVPVSRALDANPALDGGTRLGASVSAVVKQFGKPDQDYKIGIQRVLTYNLDTLDKPWSEPHAVSMFTFVGGKLRSVSYGVWG